MPTAAASSASVYSRRIGSPVLHPYDRGMLRDFPLAARVAGHATTFLTASGDKGDSSLQRKTSPVLPRAAPPVAPPRDGARGPEAFLLRRTASMAFAARMHVFPGGGLDPRDGEADVPWAGPGLDSWAQAMVVGADEAAGLVCAAVRELFEESGVLLAGPDASTVVSDVTDPSWERDR